MSDGLLIFVNLFFAALNLYFGITFDTRHNIFMAGGCTVAAAFVLMRVFAEWRVVG